jgi:hypothetical protein
MGTLKRRLLPFVAAGGLVLGMAAPAAAAPPIFVGAGLINVVIVDAVDIGDVTVQVPVAAAVNLCDLSVAAVLALIDESGSDATCTATANSQAD